MRLRNSTLERPRAFPEGPSPGRRDPAAPTAHPRSTRSAAKPWPLAGNKPAPHGEPGCPPGPGSSLSPLSSSAAPGSCRHGGKPPLGNGGRPSLRLGTVSPFSRPGAFPSQWPRRALGTAMVLPPAKPGAGAWPPRPQGPGLRAALLGPVQTPATASPPGFLCHLQPRAGPAPSRFH